MNDDQYFLANAYFDGELTDDDARIAEADPDVMSEVDRLRSAHSLLRDHDRPSAAVRTAALTAAMAEFAALTGTAGTNDHGSQVLAGHITAITRQRPASSRYPFRRYPFRRSLAIAAAVAAIGAVGVVVAGVIGDGSDNDSAGTDLAVTDTQANADPDVARAASATTLAPAAQLEAAAEPMLAEPAPAEGGADDNTAEAESSAATTAASDAAAGAVGTAMNDSTEMTAVAPYSIPYPPPGGQIEPIADRDQTITTPGQLAGLGVLLADLRDAGTLGATPETSCTFDDASIEIVDATRYRFADGTSNVLVALVAGSIEGHTLAIDPDTCVVRVVGP
jgi:hypothetical protein